MCDPLLKIFFRPNIIHDVNDLIKFHPYMLCKDKKKEMEERMDDPNIVVEPVYPDRQDDDKIENKSARPEPEPIQKPNDNTTVMRTKINTKSNDKLIYVNQDDMLFWCLFIMQHGMSEYMIIGRNYGVKELEEKKNIYEFVKKNPLLVKNTNTKITNVAIKEILSELITVQRKNVVLLSYCCDCLL